MRMRRATQAVVLIFYLIAGYAFYLLIRDELASGGMNFQLRFPGIEAFLPISALVGLKQLIATGNFDPIHPAGLSLLIIAIVSSWLFKRGLCSHFCPIGAVHELIDDLRRKAVGGSVRLPHMVHYTLMLPKYLVLGFFIYVIMIGMSGEDARAFILSPYNVISDAKMLNFFLAPSSNVMIFFAVMLLLSVVVPHFWCRYLCPYGALLNIAAVFSPLSITRNQGSCTSCKICDQRCSAGLSVSTGEKVKSPDCICCHKCINACPAQALTLEHAWISKPLQPVWYSIILALFFIAGIAAAKAGGFWQSSVLEKLWREYLPLMHSITHP